MRILIGKLLLSILIFGVPYLSGSALAATKVMSVVDELDLSRVDFKDFVPSFKGMLPLYCKAFGIESYPATPIENDTGEMSQDYFNMESERRSRIGEIIKQFYLAGIQDQFTSMITPDFRDLITANPELRNLAMPRSTIFTEGIDQVADFADYLRRERNRILLTQDVLNSCGHTDTEIVACLQACEDCYRDQDKLNVHCDSMQRDLWYLHDNISKVIDAFKTSTGRNILSGYSNVLVSKRNARVESISFTERFSSSQSIEGSLGGLISEQNTGEMEIKAEASVCDQPRTFLVNVNISGSRTCRFTLDQIVKAVTSSCSQTPEESFADPQFAGINSSCRRYLFEQADSNVLSRFVQNYINSLQPFSNL